MNNNKSCVRMLEFPVHGDERGSLISLQTNENIPFEVRRVYYIFGTSPAVIRGKHAHYKLEQILVAVSGSCEITTHDGICLKKHSLSSPNMGLYIKDLVWREMSNFSEDCVLLVLASHEYNQRDYIHDYQLFLEEAKNESE